MKRHPYISNPGSLIDGFEDVTNWTVTGTDATAANDATYFVEGTQSVKVNVDSGNWARLAQTISLDCSSDDGFSFWVYIVDTTKAGSVSLLLSSVNDYSKYFSKDIDVDYLVSGWNFLAFSKSEFTNTGTDSWDDTMIMVRIQVTPETGETTSVYLDDLRFGITGKPKVIITFDDGSDSIINKAYPIMAGNDQPGVAFIIPSVIGNANILSLANLRTLQGAGWDISNHTYEHNDLTGLGAAALAADVDDAYEWLADNGFKKTAKFFAYPGGHYNDAVIAKVKERHVLARTIRSAVTASCGAYLHFWHKDFHDLEFKLRARIIAFDLATADVATQIDEAIENGGLFILLFHKILDAGADESSEYSTANFTTVSNYIKTKQDAGSLDVVTFSDYYNDLIGKGGRKRYRDDRKTYRSR